MPPTSKSSLLATFQLHDAALDDVVHVAVSEGSIFTFAVIYRAEDGLEEPNAEDARRRETAALRLAIAEAWAQRKKALRRGVPSVEPKL